MNNIHRMETLEIDVQWTPLHYACLYNDKKTVIDLLKTTSDINKVTGTMTPIWQGYTPLHIAVTWQYTSIIEILLEHNADICVPNIDGMTSLHLADQLGFLDIEKMILESQCMRYDVNPQNKNGLSHFHIACKVVGNNQNVIKSFLATGVVDINAVVNVDQIGYVGFTPLHVCVEHSSWVGAMILLQHGADLIIKNGNGQTPFDMAYKKNDMKMFKILLDDKRILKDDVQSMLGLYQYLYKFCRFDSSDMITNLLAKGVDPNIPQITGPHAGYNALHLAVKYGNIEVIQNLLADSRTDINALTLSVQTPLHIAVEISRLDIVQLLLSKGASSVEKDDMNQTALHLARLKRDGPIMQILLAALKSYYGITPDMKKIWYLYKKAYYSKSLEMLNIISSFPDAVSLRHNAQRGINDPISLLKSITLHLAVYKGDLEMIQELLLDGVYVNVRNFYGATPLHTCIEKDQDCSLILATLLDSGADINAQTNRGETPLHLALVLRKYDAVKLLVNRGANLCVQDQDGFTALHAIAVYPSKFNSIKEKVAEVLSSSTSVNIADKQGLTPLHYAVKSNFISYIELLLHHKANPNAPNNLLETPLHIACKSADLYIIQLLQRAGASVKLKDHEGNLPLHGIVENNRWREYAGFNEEIWLFYVEIIHELLLAGGRDLDIDTKNGQGYSTLDVAVLKNNQECIDALAHCGATIDLSTLRDKCQCSCPIELLTTYLIQLDTLGLRQSVNAFEVSRSYDGFRSQCVTELQRMTDDFRANQIVPLDKIIRSSPSDIARYSLHKNVKEFIRDETIFMTYPLMGQLIVSRFLLGQRIPMEVIEYAKYALSNISIGLTEKGLPDSCTEIILRNLTQNDLYNLSDLLIEKVL